MVERGLDARTIYDLVNGVPHFDRFETVDELEESSRQLVMKYPSVVELRTIGQSSEGRPITALFIGEGDRSVFLYGFTHPNEPIGPLTVQYLASRLAANSGLRKKLGYRFILAEAIDVDGARLNEGWFRGPFDILTYALNYYRPPPNEQAEWTFPINYKTLHWTTPIAETRALMGIIDEFKPEFTYVLHNADFCGVYYYLSHELPSTYAELKEIPRLEGLSLHRGEPPDEPYLRTLDDGIYHDYGASDEYGYLAKTLNCDPATKINYGTDSYEYIRNTYGGFCFTCELPHFYDEKITDTSATPSKRRKLVLESLKIDSESHELVRRVLDETRDLIDSRSRIYRSVQYFVDRWAYVEQATRAHSEGPEFERNATVAETFDLIALKRFSQMPVLGMLERLLKDAEARTRSEKLARLCAEVHSRLLELHATVNQESDPKPISIRKLVRIQLRAAAVCLKHLNSDRS